MHQQGGMTIHNTFKVARGLVWLQKTILRASGDELRDIGRGGIGKDLE